ncbi:MAG: DUF2520 domain-containing protein [Solirubrobacteraceae bacterium]|nr:DUF2520 domain-containing protein [Solirubrobacteraceae bacterium]
MTTPSVATRRWALIGAGRLGTALAAAMRDAGLSVQGPFGRGADAAGADVVLLCVPDGEIAAAASCLTPGVTAGHVSGATTLAPLAGHPAFSLHPLMTVPAAGQGGRDGVFAGAPCAIAGDGADPLRVARELADLLGMVPVEIADEDRAAYHAAASIASNFLVTLEAAAERLAGSAGAPRELLVPLVRATVENWAEQGADALTGPIARGDELTVTRQRGAVAERTPELLPLFDALTTATRELAGKDQERAA